MSKIFLVLLLTSTLATVGVAWGPVSHYHISCAGVRAFQSEFGSGPVPELGDCLCSHPHHQQSGTQLNATLLLIGSELADAFFFGQYFTGGSCPSSSPYLHDPFYAALMIQAALNASDHDSLALAMGYASHCVFDAVGFYGTGRLGYLGNESALIDWLTKWPQMLTVDSYVLWNLTQHGGCSTPNLPATLISETTATFLSRVDATYHSISPTFPLLPPSDMIACSKQWASYSNTLYGYSELASRDQWIKQLEYFDLFGAKTAQQATSHVDMAAACGITAVSHFFNFIINQGLDPMTSLQQVVALISSLYGKGLCAPSASSSHPDGVR